MKAKFVCLYLLTVLTTSVCSMGQAQLALEMSPVHIVRTIEPGESFTKPVLFSNMQQAATVVKPVINDFFVDPGGNTHSLKAGSADYSCADWITLDRDQFTVPGGGMSGVTITIKVPRGATGERCAKIDFVPIGQEGAALGTLGFIIIINTDNENRNAAEIERLEIEPLFPEDETETISKFHLRAHVKNPGNTVSRTVGTLRLTDEAGRTLQLVDLDAGTGRILPGGLRYAEANIVALPDGIYLAHARVEYGEPRAARRWIKFKVTGSPVTHLETLPRADLYGWQGVVAEPERVQLAVPPGWFRTASFEIQNVTADSFAVELSLRDYEMDEDGHIRVLPEGSTNEVGCAGWGQLRPRRLRLASKSTRRVTMQIRGRKLAVGGRSSIIVISSKLSDGTTKHSFVPVVVMVPGTGELAGSLEPVEITKLGQTDQGVTVGLSTTLNNVSNIPLAPLFKLAVIAPEEGITEERNLLQGMEIIPAHARRTVAAEMSKPLQPGVYMAAAGVLLSGRPWLVCRRMFQITEEGEVIQGRTEEEIEKAKEEEGAD